MALIRFGGQLPRGGYDVPNAIKRKLGQGFGRVEAGAFGLAEALNGRHVPRPPFLRYRVCRIPTVSPVFAEHAAALADLCRRHGVQRLELFGSAATGQDDSAHSDFDFLVEFEPVPDGRYADAYFGVLEGLEAISFR